MDLKSSPSPIVLRPGPHLFVDEFLVESSSNVVRRVNQLTRNLGIANPIITGKEDQNFQPYLSVIRDDKTKKFRIWYGARTEDSNSMRSRLAYMESSDGIHWQRPHRVLNFPALIQFGVSVIDEGAQFKNPAQRFKYGWYMDGGLKIATSPDGLDWTLLTTNVVVPHNHDINGIFRDTLRNCYVATLSFYLPDEKWSGLRRITKQSESADLVHWSEPWPVLTPDARDEGETQFYAMDGYLIRGDLTIGMVKVLRDDLKADAPPDPPDAYGIGYTTLAWTRDGKNWTREREKFLDRNLEKNAWDHSHAWIDEQLLVGTNVFLYYAGYKRGHKMNRFEERQIGLITMPRDRYVARESGEEPGILRTPLLFLYGKKLSVNADASRGELKVQICDAAGKPIKGFSAKDFKPVTTDAVDAPLRWKRPLSEMNRKPVRLEFLLKNAQLFAFELE
ncbi:MAG: hypothetical protein ABIR24_07205 [Verrucomicrobiota bacterium]